jgi:zinc D-Ala-D-Ala carboxypeptidase
MNLSEHFTLEELTTTQVRLDNQPPVGPLLNLKELAREQLEKVRALLNVPIRINSGYRSPEVNKTIGGAATSQHVLGCAADFVPVGMTLKEAYELIAKSDIQFDQLIYERPNPKNYGWIHIGRKSGGVKGRRQLLMYVPVNGKPQYIPYTGEALAKT